jgi:hypothetical protein
MANNVLTAEQIKDLAERFRNKEALYGLEKRFGVSAARCCQIANTYWATHTQVN